MQVSAQGDLQTIAATVEQFRASKGTLPSPDSLRKILGQRAERDPWGNAYAYVVYQRQEGEHFVIVCLGADGKLDVASPELYLNSKETTVAYQYSRDIVVVDGSFVQNAGK